MKVIQIQIELFRGDMMSVILQERGRGKFRPSLEYKIDEVKAILNAKIQEEKQEFENCCNEI